jgi:hypothetical protein
MPTALQELLGGARKTMLILQTCGSLHFGESMEQVNAFMTRSVAASPIYGEKLTRFQRGIQPRGGVHR